jgi:hypothetical protein
MVVANPTRSLYPVYAARPELRREPQSDPRRARAALSAKPVPVPSSSDFCALRVSAFSSPDLCPFNFRLAALSVVEGSTSNRPSFRPLSAVDCKLSAVSCRPFFPNSHRIIFFAHPHPLTPIESYSCKKQGRGWGIRDFLSAQSLPLFSTPSKHSTRSNARNPIPFMRLLHSSLDTRGVGHTSFKSNRGVLPRLFVSSAQSILAKPYQNKRLQLPLESMPMKNLSGQLLTRSPFNDFYPEKPSGTSTFFHHPTKGACLHRPTEVKAVSELPCNAAHGSKTVDQGGSGLAGPFGSWNDARHLCSRNPGLAKTRRRDGRRSFILECSRVRGKCAKKEN